MRCHDNGPALVLLAMAAAMLPGATVFAQVSTQGVDSARPSAESLRPALSPATPDNGALPDRPLPPRELARPEGDLHIDVRRYAIDGGPARLQSEVARITAPYVGPGRSYPDLVEAADAVTRFLQSDLGYYLGYAYVPEQAPADGVIHIAVLEGRLDEVILNWSDGLPVRREVVESYLALLKPGEILTIRDVERVVFLLNDLRGMTARFELREGRAWGTASIVVTPASDGTWSRHVDLDVDGSRYSGVERLGATGILNSPGGRGDGVTLGGMTSLTGGLNFAVIGYTTPIGVSGLKMGASLTAFRYHLDTAILAPNYSGTATATTAYGLYPVIRSRNLNLFASASYEYKAFDDREGDDNSETRKYSNDIRVGATGDLRDDLLTGGVDTYDFEFTGGRIGYRSRAPSGDDARSFVKLGFNVSRLQNLVTDRLLLYINFRGQLTDRNLDATEQYRLGGADGVRAYASGETTGDSGQILTTELRLLPPAQWFGSISRQLVLAAFFDWGQIHFRSNASARGSAFVNHADLAGAGVSVAWERPRDISLRVQVSQRTLGKAISDPVVRKPQVYAELSKQF